MTAGVSFTHFFPDLKRSARAHLDDTGRPLVTLSYAQSMDGSITHRRGEPLALSGPESLRFTHQLRDAHDAILVGIGTVLADDPRLTVRSIRGVDPQPVVLDSRLRLPRDARIWEHPRVPWIFVGQHPSVYRVRAVMQRGARVFSVPSSSGRYLDLGNVLDELGSAGIAALMVEGGASVITSFLVSGMVDQVVITIAPRFVGGVRTLEERLDPMPALRNPRSIQLGRDVVIIGSLQGV